MRQFKKGKDNLLQRLVNITETPQEHSTLNFMDQYYLFTLKLQKTSHNIKNKNIIYKKRL